MAYYIQLLICLDDWLLDLLPGTHTSMELVVCPVINVCPRTSPSLPTQGWPSCTITANSPFQSGNGHMPKPDSSWPKNKKQTKGRKIRRKKKKKAINFYLQKKTKWTSVSCVCVYISNRTCCIWTKERLKRKNTCNAHKSDLMSLF